MDVLEYRYGRAITDITPGRAVAAWDACGRLRPTCTHGGAFQRPGCAICIAFQRPSSAIRIACAHGGAFQQARAAIYRAAIYS